MRTPAIIAVLCGLCLGLPGLALAEQASSGEQVYDQLSALAREDSGDRALLRRLNETARSADFAGGEAITVVGNIRRLRVAGEGIPDLYLVREESGTVHVLAMPAEAASDGPYAGLDGVVGKKVTIQARRVTAEIDGRSWTLVQLTAAPERLLLDRLFFIAIVILLFLTMVGMGLTLTVRDFAIVFRKPAGMIIGPICQFGLLPLIAMGLGYLAGYHDTYPFIFLGLILIAASPGGVTSNLMTYFGKGDLALSVSLTAVCTVLALFFTPLLMTAYSTNIPAFSIPVGDVVKQMLILVIVPLFVGMLIRWRAPKTAKKLEKPFSLVGLFSVLFLIVVGILGNLEKFGDTERYGLKFYAIVFVLTFTGMLAAALMAKVVRVKNFQVRAIALECGLRNASLAMTIALLLQDQMGDFYSSMFFTSGIFGLWMYVAGFISIAIFKKVLPVTDEDLAELERAKAGEAAKS